MLVEAIVAVTVVLNGVGTATESRGQWGQLRERIRQIVVEAGAVAVRGIHIAPIC